jgi:hypothetical protein
VRTLIIAAALALGTLGFASVPTVQAAYGWGHHHGYYGGYRGWGGYRHGYWGYYGRPYWRGYYGARPYYGYGYYPYTGYYGYSYPGFYGSYPSAFCW